MSTTDIIARVAEARGVTVKAIRFGGAHKHVAYPRHEAMWLLRRHTNLSFPSIGNLLGGRDHSTVMSGVKRVQALVEARPHYAAELDGLLRPVRYIPLKGMFAEEGAGL